MPWFKVDDKLHDHRKTRAAGKAAMGVWVLAGSWSADNLTDGFVPASVLSRWGTRADANKLVSAGLWVADEQDGEKGWRFHQWNEDGRQPTREETLARREVRAAAGRMGGKASGRSRREAKVKQVASPVVEPPARPDPTTAAAAAGAQPLPPSLEILKAKLDAAKMTARWDRLTADQHAVIEQLIDLHGDGPLVKSAIAQYRPGAPAVFAQAWLAGWMSLVPAGTGLRVVSDPCPESGHSGTTDHCTQCASERLERKPL